VGIALSDLVADYKASLLSAAEAFTDPTDFERHLRIAARAMAVEKRPRQQVGVLTLVADQTDYPDVPADFLAPKVALWGSSNAPVWDMPRQGLPVLTSGTDENGVAVLILTPAPTAEQIRAYGSTYRYYYAAAHVLSNVPSDSTITERDRDLLILRAQVEAMRELTFRATTKPVTLRDGSHGGGPSNMQPAAIYERLLREWKEAS